MGNAGAIGKQPSGLQWISAALKFHFAVSPRHILDGVKWKRLPMNGVIRRAMLQATADDPQRPVFAGLRSGKNVGRSPHRRRRNSGVGLADLVQCKSGFHPVKSKMSMHWSMIAIPDQVASKVFWRRSVGLLIIVRLKANTN